MGTKEQLQIPDRNGSGHKKTKLLTINEFIARSNVIHNSLYDYSKSIYVNTSTKITIICPVHGSFEQRPADHLKGRGCSLCGRKAAGKSIRLDFRRFIDRANLIHNSKYNYKKTAFKTIRDKSVIICPIHGEFVQSISNHLAGSGCPRCYSEGRVGLNRLNTEEFINKSNYIHMNRYDYRKTKYVLSNERVIITCPEHGDFYQTPNGHLNGSGCQLCGTIKSASTKRTNYPFIERAISMHGNLYDYSLVNYINNATPVEIICKTHGIFQQSPNSHLRGCGCIKCSNNTSRFENIIERYLTNRNISFKTHVRFPCKYPNMPKTIEFDFYIPDKNIAIEVNGIYWHSECSGRKNRYYHLNKTKVANSNGIKLIHIFETEFSSIKRVLYRLNSILGLNTRCIYARNCEVREITNKEKKLFLDKTHLQGNDRSSIYLGLFNRNKLCSVMTFGNRRISLGSKHIKNEFELYRFSSIGGLNVIGGAGKLLKFFIHKYTPTKLWSYCDLRWSTGSLYYNLGFKLDHISTPNYWYFRRGDKLYHRYAFRKCVLNKKLKNFDAALSEWENMKINKYDRIWDCGNYVFVMEFFTKT